MSESGSGFLPPFQESADAVPVALPSSTVAAPPPAVAYAGFWRRFAAFFIDAILLFAIGIAAKMLMRGVAGLPLAPIWKESSGSNPFSNCLETLLGIIVGWVYAASLESSEKQATVGKMAIGIRVTDLAGRRISFGRATGRHFAQILDVATLLIGYAMAGFTAKKQALHDMIAGTLVIRRSKV